LRSTCRQEEGSVRSWVPVGFGLLLAVLLLFAVLAYVNTERLLANEARVANTREVLASLRSILLTLTEAETGQRGYLLTAPGHDEYLRPYNDAVQRIGDELKRLRAMTADNPSQQARLDSLAHHINAKLAELDYTIRLRREQGPGPALEVVLTDRGHTEMVAARDTVAEMEAEERNQLEARTRESVASAGVSRWSIVLGAAVAVVVLGLARGLVRREAAVRQAAAEAVRREREWFETTLLGIGDGVIVTDGSGHVRLLNPVAVALTGWTQADAAGRLVTEVFHIVNEETRRPVENPVERCLKAGVVVGLANHTLLIARDGTERPIDDSGAPIRAGGGVVGAVLVFRDISAKRRSEDELRRQAQQLAEADRRKDEFLALLGHELRNPLAPLRNGLSLLQLKSSGDPNVARLGPMMERQLAILVRLVDDLLDVARIARGKIELRKQPVDLTALAGRAVESARSALDERRHRLELEFPDGPVWVDADPARVEQVLNNLLSNAARYTPPQGHVWLSVARVGEEAVLRVRDNGIGIRPESMPEIWDMFRQADRIEGRLSEGLGLGLNLVRRLVELHDGKVMAISDGPGKGSEFRICLPALPPGAVPSSEAETVPRLASDSGGTLRVLVVDDSTDAAESLAVLLRLDGHEVRTAGNGAQALAVAKEFRPQAVLLDIGLPGGMSGFDVARHLRREPGLEQVLLVAVTGYGTSEDVARAREAEFDHYVTKPADPGLVRLLLAERRSQY
jgi:PAS domain S-box-containing protein